MKINSSNSFVKALALLTVFSAAAAVPSLKAQTIYPQDNGFELPDQGSGGLAYTYFPTSTNWNFNDETLNTASNPASGGNGISANDSYFNLSAATNGNSDGTTSTAGQAAFINGNIGISQNISGFTAGSYTVSFSLESRGGDGGTDPIQVYLDSVLLGTFTPTTTATFDDFTTTSTVLTAGAHEILFQGTDATGSNTSFLDNVSISAASVPEPSALDFGLIGLAALVVVKLSRKNQVQS